MQGAFIYSTFLSKAIVNFEYNNIHNDYDSTKNYLKEILDYEKDELLNAGYLTDPSFIYLYNSDVVLKGNKISEVHYY